MAFEYESTRVDTFRHLLVSALTPDCFPPSHSAATCSGAPEKRQNNALDALRCAYFLTLTQSNSPAPDRTKTPCRDALQQEKQLSERYRELYQNQLREELLEKDKKSRLNELINTLLTRKKETMSKSRQQSKYKAAVVELQQHRNSSLTVETLLNMKVVSGPPENKLTTGLAALRPLRPRSTTTGKATLANCTPSGNTTQMMRQTATISTNTTPVKVKTPQKKPISRSVGTMTDPMQPSPPSRMIPTGHDISTLNNNVNLTSIPQQRYARPQPQNLAASTHAINSKYHPVTGLVGAMSRIMRKDSIDVDDDDVQHAHNHNRSGTNSRNNRNGDRNADDSDDETNNATNRRSDFMTAKQYGVATGGLQGARQPGMGRRNGTANGLRKVGAPATTNTNNGLNSKFVSPLQRDDQPKSKRARTEDKKEDGTSSSLDPELLGHPALRNIEPKMIEMIMNEIMDSLQPISWDDIAGLNHAKTTIQESVIWPMLRPDIFTGLRAAPKGILLYGPPGTGKTLIGKCIASQSGATFFSISSSSLTSKYVGDGEKMVRALFAVARVQSPSVIFIDEIDSLLTARTDGEFEASRRIKTEFLVQFDGVGVEKDDRILLIGATNRPNELDEAARRRFRKRLYIELPDFEARKALMIRLLRKQSNELTEDQIDEICRQTDGYSGSDMDNLCREAALGPIRSITDIRMIDVDAVRPVTYDDFLEALTQVKKSVSAKDLEFYKEFDKEFGSGKR